ncbi:MAG: TPM domain-containing protein [Bacteroidota bacterium]
MNLLSFFTGRKKSFFSKEDEERMVQAIRFAEKQTSGEVRLYIESHCSYISPIDRAKELFATLNMHETKDRNGVLLYFAMKDRQMAIWGDEGIHQKMGQAFWEKEVASILSEFKSNHFVEGICHMIHDVGDALKMHFPYTSDDKNELDDNIVFGK